MGIWAIGLMSGTSLDGIDAALVHIEGYGKDTKVDLIEFYTESYSDELKTELLQCMDQDKSHTALISSLHFKLGYVFAEAAKKVCEAAQISLEQVSFIASHGQTIYHLPETMGPYERSTLQIGEPAVIAYETGTKVISNFRSMDMAAGGEGAPLVPYVDYVLFHDDKKNRALQNIGGIGNVTVIPKNAELHDVFAFDTGPGNMVIDECCRRLKGKPFDDAGKWASQGKVHMDIIEALMGMEFFKKQPPKSTGRELFGAQFVDSFLETYGHLPVNDVIATATYFTAYSMLDAYKRFVFPKTSIDEIIVGGGGSKNPTLLRFMQELVPNITIKTFDEIGFSSDAKEAIAFAILGNETVHMRPANVPSATGAVEPVILGSITFPPKGMDKKGGFA